MLQRKIQSKNKVKSLYFFNKFAKSLIEKHNIYPHMFHESTNYNIVNLVNESI